jgi:UDP-glucose 4-epimerase
LAFFAVDRVNVVPLKTGTPARVLVTGGAGFIGSHLVHALINRAHSVTVIDDLSTGLRENVNERANLVVGNITDFGLIRDAIAESDACIHLAAIASVERCNAARVESHQINQSAFVGLLEAIARRRGGPIPVVYASSAAVYGEASHFPTREDTPARPLSVYGADKLGCELQARAAAAAGVPSFGLRLYNVYGAGQHLTLPYSGVISIFVDRALSGEPLTIYGDGIQVRDFIHVDDVARYIITALARASTEATVCNIGTGIGTSILDLARMLSRALHSTSGTVFKAHRQSDILRSVADISLSKKIFQFEPQIPLWNGLLSFARLIDRRDVTVDV